LSSKTAQIAVAHGIAESVAGTGVTVNSLGSSLFMAKY
jgi:hypothetical protein